MSLLLCMVLLVPYSPADSARALVTMREVPLRALLFAEQASRIDGAGVLELGRLLELAGRFDDAGRVYALAAGGAVASTSGWLADRLRGVSVLDTTLVLEASLTNLGDTIVRNVVLMVPRPFAHEPYQTMRILSNDFSGGGPVLTCLVASLAPGETAVMNIRMELRQRPHTFRPIREALSDSILNEILGMARRVEGTRSAPGPCLEMSLALARQVAGNGIPIHVAGGLVQRGDSLVFHAWTVLDSIVPGLPVDPLLLRTDSLMAVGHCPSDMIPLWNLDYTDGCELSALYTGLDSNLEMSMRAYFTER